MRLIEIEEWRNVIVDDGGEVVLEKHPFIDRGQLGVVLQDISQLTKQRGPLKDLFEVG